MTNVRKKQIRTLGILLVTVITLAVGFAAFSSSLLIKTRLSVNPNNGTFLVKFSNSSSTLDESDVVPTKSSDIFTAYNGEIDNDTGIPTISNLGGQFTQPGEKITYDFYTLNTGSYNAYLTDVIFNNVEGESTNKVCTSTTGENQSQVDEACKGISIKVIMGIDTIIGTRTMVGHTLAPNASEPVKVVIEYSSTAVLPEVEFTVDFGTISMLYNSLEESDIEEEEFFSCYISTKQGEITDYLVDDPRCGKNLTDIPERLPISTIESISFNLNKCLEGEEILDELGFSSSFKCDEIAANFESMDQSQIIEQYQDFLALGYDPTMTDDQNQSSAEVYVALAFHVVNALEATYNQSGPKYDINRIGNLAFTFNGIESVVLPSNIEEVGGGAFYQNDITTLSMSNVRLIEADAFAYNSIESVTIPSSMVIINMSAFRYNSISTLDLSGATNLTAIKNAAFATNSITSLDLSHATSLTTIGSAAFSGNYLTSINIPNSVKTIGYNAFRYNSLTSVEIGSGIESIDNHAFDDSLLEYYETTYGPNAIESVRIHKNKDTSILGIDSFGWISGKTDDDICWNDICSN